MKKVAALALVLLAAACGEGAAQEPEPRRPFDWSALPGGWTALEEPPFVRARAAAVWTGSELFYWGGDTDYGGTSHAEGALFDPATRSWRPTAAAPIGGRSSPAAVWTGREVLIWGGWATSGEPDDGAAYDPAADAWRLLPDSPLSGRDPIAAVWTGMELLVWGDAARGGGDVEGAAYDPASDSWRKLAPAPFGLNEADAVWTGAEMIVYGALLDGNNWSETKHARGLAYDPVEDRWREIADYPLSPQASAVAWSGREMVVWDYELAAGAYEPSSDTWRPLPDLPLEFWECYPRAAASGEVFLAWQCGRAALLEVAGSKWRLVPPPVDEIHGWPVMAGPVFLFPGASHEGRKNALWAYRPQGDTSFVPEAADEDERIRLPLVFPDGQRVVLSYPRHLALAGLGVQPDVSYLYRNDPSPRFPLTFVHGPATARPSEIALHAGSWTILAKLREPDEREVVAQRLQVRETPDGFPVVEALPPLALSHEFGEGGGVQLGFGDLRIEPEVVSSLDPYIEIAPTSGCALPPDDVEISHGHGARCFGDFYVGVYGDRPYIEAVLDGLRIEEG